MPEANNWNDKTITEFRANCGRVGGNFEGAPVALVHHRGRKSGREYVNPMMYLPDDADNDAIYVFATKGGAPSNPDWYYNLTAAGQGTVERGAETNPVTVRELQGDERDRIYDEQARGYPGFADYAKRTAGIRTITQPVSERDHIRGLHGADMSLVEYGDFECPYCRAAEPIVAGLIEALGGRLSVTFCHFPLSRVHSHAGHAAEVAEAAAAQGKFWEMHDTLFARQNALDDADLLKYTAELSLDSDRISRELAGHAFARRGEEHQQSGLDSGVSDPPTFYIDGIRYDGSVALRDMLAAIRQLHPDLEPGDAAATNSSWCRLAVTIDLLAGPPSAEHGAI